jgi:hypothetical protein
MATGSSNFEPFGSCRNCGRRASGSLYDFHNSKLGDYCKRCADRAIKQAHHQGRFLPDAARADQDRT